MDKYSSCLHVWLALCAAVKSVRVRPYWCRSQDRTPAECGDVIFLHTLHQKMAGHSNSNTLDKGLMVAKWWLCAVITYALALCFPELPDCMEKIHPALLHVLHRAGRCCAVLRVLVGAARCCAGAARRWAISGLNKRGAARCCAVLWVLRGAARVLRGVHRRTTVESIRLVCGGPHCG